MCAAGPPSSFSLLRPRRPDGQSGRERHGELSCPHVTARLRSSRAVSQPPPTAAATTNTSHGDNPSILAFQLPQRRMQPALTTCVCHLHNGRSQKRAVCQPAQDSNPAALLDPQHAPACTRIPLPSPLQRKARREGSRRCTTTTHAPKCATGQRGHRD